MNHNYFETIQIVKRNERAAARLASDPQSPRSLVAFDLSAAPNIFWKNLFYALWAEKLKADAVSAGAFSEQKNLTDAQRREFRNHAYDLQRRISSPRESCAPMFNSNSERPTTIAWCVQWPVLYGGDKAYAVRVREVIEETNKSISDYPPLLERIKADQQKTQDADERRVRAEKILSTFEAVLAASRSALDAATETGRA
jgi:hypothetical protein